MCVCVKNVDHELLVERKCTTEKKNEAWMTKTEREWGRERKKKKREKKVETIMNIIVSMCDFSVTF